MIELKNVSKVYYRDETETVALDEVDLSIGKGEIFGVIGFSGAGKSTLVRLINFLEQPTSGSVYVDNKNLFEYSPKQLRVVRKDIGMIFQHFNLLNSKTIYHNIAMPLILSKTPKHVVNERVLELLEFVGLKDKAMNYPNELSGGQKQRIGIARALATNPSILLCDEATSALDPQTTDSILRLLQKINEQYNITIVIITHEMSIIQKICHKVAVMEEGRIIEKGEVAKVFSNPKQQATKNFVSTVMKDGLPENIKIKVQKAEKSRILKVVFSDQTNAAINRWIMQYGITVNIIYSSINDIKTKTVGILFLQIKGDEEKMIKAINDAKNSSIFIKELTY